MMWNKLAIILMLFSSQVYGEEAEVGMRLSYQKQGLSNSSFVIPKVYRNISRQSVEQDAYLHLQQGIWTFNGQVAATQEINGNLTDEKGIIHELYVDTSIGNLEGSFGKKVVSWGTGYGFRPLDVIQRESRQALRTFNLEGVPMVLLEYFTKESALSTVISNRLRFGGITPRKGKYEMAVKYSTLLGNSDLHLLLYQQQGNGLSAGIAASTVVGEQLELHGSARYLSVYHKALHKLSGQPVRLLSNAQVFSQQRQYNGVQALLGGSWTWENGFSLMLEAWHDDTAYSRQQWLELLRINRFQQKQLALGAPPQAVYNNTYANSLIYSKQNILKDTVFMRLSYDGDKLDPELSLLHTPLDGGVVLTVSANYAWSQNVSLFGSVRLLSGRKNSAYRASSERSQVFVGLQLLRMIK